MSWIIIISLIIIGLIFLVLEILVIPGVIVGIIGAVMVIMGVFFSYNNGSTAGNITLAGTVLLSIFTLIFIFRSKTWDRLTLKNENKSRVNEIEENAINTGDTLLSVSKIKPIGKARLGTEYYEVTSVDGYIDENKEIEVFKIEGNKIYVKIKEDKKN